MAVAQSEALSATATNNGALPTVFEEDSESVQADDSRNASKSCRVVNQAMCSKDLPTAATMFMFNQNNSKKPSISELVMKQMLKNGMQPVQKSAADFFFLKTLGEGSFSTVYLAREVSTGKEYSVKVLNKDLIRRHDKVVSVMREKDIMTSLTYLHGGHPLFVSLYCTFQDATRLYFAMTYAKHGDLLTFLHRLGSFDDEVTLFYSAEIVSVLDYLHKCGIIHRDLKPENILINENWHILLSDFGTAKFLEHNENQEEKKQISHCDNHRSRSTFVGTAQYVSPEVLVDGDVGPSCDYWALGAIIFQMVSGMPPFRSVNDYQTFQKIQKLDYAFPEGFPDLSRHLVSKLLVLDPRKRLGSEEMGGNAVVRSHPYFSTVDWDNLLKQKPPLLKPYLPASCGEPAFHSEYNIPCDIEPGLDDSALTRLMGLTLKDFVPSDEPENDKEEMQTSNINDRKLSVQRKEHKYHRFVEDNLIIKCGLLDKKKGLFARRRMFLLTEGPRIYYVDPVSMELKGLISFSRQLRTEAKNFRTFFVHTPNRTYYLFDPERNAMEWCSAIEGLRERYINELPDEPEDINTKSSKRR